MRIHAVILAGGIGRRMGADKALAPLGGHPLLAHVLARIAPQVAQVALSANGDPARFSAFGLPVLPDEEPLGPLSGLLAGLRWAARQGADALLAVPVDAPFLPRDLVARLKGGRLPALVRAGDRLQGPTGLWPVSAAAALADFLASGAKPKVTDFADLLAPRIVEFSDAAAFANLNTRQDLAGAEARLVGGPA